MRWQDGGVRIGLYDANCDLLVGRQWRGKSTGGGWRWTDGDAVLAVAGGAMLEVEVAMTQRYWHARRRHRLTGRHRQAADVAARHLIAGEAIAN